MRRAPISNLHKVRQTVGKFRISGRLTHIRNVTNPFRWNQNTTGGSVVPGPPFVALACGDQVMS